jgi:hypothetical protein
MSFPVGVFVFDPHGLDPERNSLGLELAVGHATGKAVELSADADEFADGHLSTPRRYVVRLSSWCGLDDHHGGFAS